MALTLELLTGVKVKDFSPYILTVTNKTISKDTYFYTLPSIPSHQGRGNLLPLPWWERARVSGCGFTYELLSSS
jgi:hypothetical protein